MPRELPAWLLLLDGDHPAGGHFVECLHRATGPGNRQLVDDGGVAQPEVHAPVILRKIARTGNALALLPNPAGDYFDLRADSVPVALLADQMNADPMPGGSRRIAQQDARSAQIHQERIHLAVVVIVREGGPPVSLIHISEPT